MSWDWEDRAVGAKAQTPCPDVRWPGHLPQAAAAHKVKSGYFGAGMQSKRLCGTNKAEEGWDFRGGISENGISRMRFQNEISRMRFPNGISENGICLLIVVLASD